MPHMRLLVLQPMGGLVLCRLQASASQHGYLDSQQLDACRHGSAHCCNFSRSVTRPPALRTGLSGAAQLSAVLLCPLLVWKPYALSCCHTSLSLSPSVHLSSHTHPQSMPQNLLSATCARLLCHCGAQLPRRELGETNCGRPYKKVSEGHKLHTRRVRCSFCSCKRLIALPGADAALLAADDHPCSGSSYASGRTQASLGSATQHKQ